MAIVGPELVVLTVAGSTDGEATVGEDAATSTLVLEDPGLDDDVVAVAAVAELLCGTVTVVAESREFRSSCNDAGTETPLKLPAALQVPAVGWAIVVVLATCTVAGGLALRCATACASL